MELAIERIASDSIGGAGTGFMAAMAESWWSRVPSLMDGRAPTNGSNPTPRESATIANLTKEAEFEVFEVFIGISTF